MRVPTCGLNRVVWTCCRHWRREPLGFLNGLLRWFMGLQSCQQSNTKNEVRLFITLCLLVLELSHTDPLYSWKIILASQKTRQSRKTHKGNEFVFLVGLVTSHAQCPCSWWQMNGSDKPPSSWHTASASTIQSLHLERSVPSCSSGSGLILLLRADQPTSFLRVHIASLVGPQFSDATLCCFRPVSHTPLRGCLRLL